MIDSNVADVGTGLDVLKADVAIAIATLGALLAKQAQSIDAEDLAAIKADKVAIDALHAQLSASFPADPAPTPAPVPDPVAVDAAADPAPAAPVANAAGV